MEGDRQGADTLACTDMRNSHPLAPIPLAHPMIRTHCDVDSRTLQVGIRAPAKRHGPTPRHMQPTHNTGHQHTSYAAQASRHTRHTPQASCEVVARHKGSYQKNTPGLEPHHVDGSERPGTYPIQQRREVRLPLPTGQNVTGKRASESQSEQASESR